MHVRKISTYVLNYNGASLLSECLPSLVSAQFHAGCDAKLWVIDNCSTDNSLKILRNQFPTVAVLEAPANRYLCSFNDYVFKDNADIVVLMNNDVKVKNDFLFPIVKIFEEQDDAFMASPLCFNFSDQQYQGGLSILYKKFGWWGTRSVDPRLIVFPYTISMGACVAFRRDRFTTLGGFDDLYLPGILEDLDIGFRGWKHGWKAYVAQESVVYHKGQASFKMKFSTSKIRSIAVRNTFFFIWKNISDGLFLIEHFFWLVPRMLYALFVRDLSFISGCFQAFRMASFAFSRRERKLSVKRSDRDILNIFQGLPKE